MAAVAAPWVLAVLAAMVVPEVLAGTLLVRVPFRQAARPFAVELARVVPVELAVPVPGAAPEFFCPCS